MPVPERDVRRPEVTVARQGQPHVIAVCAQPLGQSGLEVPAEFQAVGDRVLVVGAVGRMHIDEEVRRPGIEHPQPRLHLGRVGLEEIPVEVQVLRRDAPPHLARSVLVDAAVGREALVSVHVEDRHEQQRDVREPAVGQLGVRREIPQQQHARVLAAAFAGVDAGFDQQHHVAGSIAQLRGGISTSPVGDHQGQRAALRAAPELGQRDEVRRVGQFLQPGHRLRIPRRVLSAGRLVRSSQRRTVGGSHPAGGRQTRRKQKQGQRGQPAHGDHLGHGFAIRSSGLGAKASAGTSRMRAAISPPLGSATEPSISIGLKND